MSNHIERILEMVEGLKNCPFCGSVAGICRPLDFNVVQCSRCKAAIVEDDGGMDKAIEQWNKRAA